MPRSSDPAHKETDIILANMEKEISSVYTQAYKEAKQTADDFMKQFQEADKKKREAMMNGDIDKEEYARWRRTQLFQGKRYQRMADTLAADMTSSKQIAASVINGHLPEVYALNHNYGTYEMEHGGRVDTQYTLYDRQTVERLLREDPDLLPHARVDIPADIKWNKQTINSAITQGILQGEEIDKIASRLAHTVTDMSRTSAIRNARTMTTSAENGGRIDSYKRAEKMGIKMLQVWMSTLDDRTRHEHRQLDGQKRKVGEPFEVDGYKIEFPADPKAEPHLVYNCRCTLIGQVEGVNFDLSDVTQRDNKLGDKTYEEWKEEKREEKEDKQVNPAPSGKAVEIEIPGKNGAKTIDKTVENDIIKIGHKMAADSDFELPDKTYEVKEDKAQVEAAKKYAKETLGVGNVKFDKLKNNEIIQPMLEQLNELKIKHKKGFYQIFIDDTMDDRDFAEVYPDLSLHLNAKYMNSKEAADEIIHNMIAQKKLPTGFDDTRYIITHEYMHFISRSEIDDPKSKAHKVIPDEETRNITAPSFNSTLNENEYAADAMAVIELGNEARYKKPHWKLWNKIYEYFFKEENNVVQNQ